MRNRNIALISFLLLVLAMLVSPNRSAAGSASQVRETKRDAQILRDLNNQDHPERRFLSLSAPAAESAGVESASAPDLRQGVFAPDYEPPGWANRILMSLRDYESWKFYILHADGTEQLLDTGKENSIYPALSKNGAQVAFASDQSGNLEIYAISSSGSNLRQLTNHGATDNLPAWSPDGSLIAFDSDRTGNFDIYIMDGNGNGLTELTSSPAYDGEPSWSPDGSQLVFVSNRTGFYELWIMNADGSDQHAITSGALAFTPDWSPLGNRIAFANDSNYDGFYEIWLVDPEGSYLKSFDSGGSNQDAWAPAWSPDGKWLSFIRTSWRNIEGQWYWTESYFMYEDLFGANQSQPSADKLVWRADWSADDPLPPLPCTVTMPEQLRWREIPLQFLAQDQGASGSYAFDAEVRLPGGEWTDFVSWLPGGGAVYTGSTTGQFEFRCRAYDLAGNVGEWSPAPALSPLIDAAPPVSRASSPQRLVRGNQASVSWQGSDRGSGLASYDVFYRDGQQGDWTRWLSGTPSKEGIFTGTPGHTYDFHSQAHDQVGHAEPWNPEAQASVTFYSTILTVMVTDQRGYPVAALVGLDSPGAFTELQPELDLYQFYLGVEASHTITVSAPGYATLPSAQVGTEADSVVNWVLSSPADLINNGGFESGTLEGWSVSGSGASLTADERHSGAYALQLAQALTETVQVSQAILLDSSLYKPTLSFLYRIPEGLDSGGFKVEISGLVTQTLLETAAATDGWAHAWADLKPFAGQSITLTLKLEGSDGAVQVDEISLGAWETPVPDSVSPSEWIIGRAVTLAVSGENFQPTPTLLLNDFPLLYMTWISSTQLSAVVPQDIPQGTYHLRVSNPSGNSAILSDEIRVSALPVYLPFVLKNSVVGAAPPTTDWRMFGYDVARTGYNRGEAGASRYSLAWTADVGSDLCYSRQPFAVADGVLVVANSCEKQSVALDAETGAQLWHHDLSGWPTLPTISNGLVYYGTGSDPYIVAADLYSGQTILGFSSEEYIEEGYQGQQPLLLAEQSLLTPGACWNAASGALEWSKYFGYEYDLGYQVAYEDGIVYSWGGGPWDGGIFRALNPKTGGTWWSYQANQYFSYQYREVPVLSQGIAVVTTENVTINAIDLTTHQLVWTAQNDQGLYGFPAFSAVADGVVYTADNLLMARRLTDGELLWSFTPDDHDTYDEKLFWNPIVTKKYIYVSSANQIDQFDRTYVIDRATHQVVWKTDSAGWLAVANGFLYIVSDDNVLYAYRAQEE